ncbi:DegT/DnrJ/EryC1/StrS family aminotransferase [Effusibacillus lacus]|uniref:Pleiotropic regulatory protein n=1 Tax=Effusibacillus lacus TaxID=1348429 RepID=A0A292YU09_9BACL|nr:DegT/DnrJ/EryC1/StrS family aminotransferase [Effusibacillus lacus]GAX91980.1 pleiotropic regulatory protein [Effusibacillus lacus]
MRIPFVDLKAQYSLIRTEVEEAIQKVLESGQYVMGDNVAEFEHEAADYLQAAEAVSVGNGSDALYLSLKAFDIGPGDEVITTPFSFVATGDSILRTGAVPVFVDIDPDSFNLDPQQIEERITNRTKAILPVHLYGQCALMDKITEIANKHSLIVIEDACQAFGSGFSGQKAGTWGHAGCFSFFPTKNLGAFGDGGMITCSNRDLAKKIRLLREHGSESRYHHTMLGINSRLDEIQAAVLRIKLRYIDAWNRKRREIAAQYSSLLQGLPLVLPQTKPAADHIYHLFTVRTSDSRERTELITFLGQNGIQVSVHYPKPIYLQPSYQQLGYKQGLCPVAEQLSQQVLCLPLYPEMAGKAVLHVARSVIAFYKGGGDS